VLAAGLTVAEGEGVGDALAVGDALGVACSAGCGSATPLFQMSFFPDFMQVYLVDAVDVVAPTFVQEPPALTDACDMGAITSMISARGMTKARVLMSSL
jgi:hypothetical protein